MQSTGNRKWRDLTRHDPEEFVRRVTEAIRAEDWVVDGNYGPVRERVWRRATHLIWLDYERAVIMARVISRSFFRAPSCGPVTESDGAICYTPATRSSGPGARGTGGGAKPRSD